MAGTSKDDKGAELKNKENLKAQTKGDESKGADEAAKDDKGTQEEKQPQENNANEELKQNLASFKTVLLNSKPSSVVLKRFKTLEDSINKLG